MGISLEPVGNHSITFQNKSFEELCRKITAKLNTIQFTNEDFLMRNSSRYNSGTMKEGWRYDPDEPDWVKNQKQIMVVGPYGLELDFWESHILFWNPHYRYWQWFEMWAGGKYTNEINEWRKYFQQILSAFGGNRIIYFADDPYPFQEYSEALYESSFDEVEKRLRAELGPPSTDLLRLAEGSDEHLWYLDELKDIPSPS
jgi:hypothetical protein